MGLNPAVWQIPLGVRDVLPGEAQRRRYLEEKLCGLFASWGYREIIPPSLEYYEQLKGSSSEEQLYKLIDHSGRILALRPDLTTPIARMVATHLSHEPLPIRLYYFGNAFRYEMIQAGRQREFYQAGVELIGAAGTGADAEAIALAVEAIKLAGVADFQVGIGQVAVTQGLLENAGVPQHLVREFKWLMARKDYVALENRMSQLGLPPEQTREILAILSLRGSLEVLLEARALVRTPAMLRAIDDLETVYHSLEAMGLATSVFFDFSILRDLEYYTGIVFEGYAAGLGYPICGGGRYDHLLGQFGMDVPAVGFALGVDRVMQALPPMDEKKTDALVTGGSLPERLVKARQLREQGLTVEVDILGLSREEALHYMSKKQIVQLIELGEAEEGV